MNNTSLILFGIALGLVGFMLGQNYFAPWLRRKLAERKTKNKPPDPK